MKRPSKEVIDVVAAACARADAESRAPRLLFVCLGNICRSPAAQGVAEDLASERGINIECDSAGFYGGHTGDLPDPRMRQAAFARGLRLEHRSRVIREYDLDDFDIVFGMDDRNIADLHRLAATPEQDAKIVRMIDFCKDYPNEHSVPDPYYGGASGFDYVLDLLEDGISILLDEIQKQTI